MEEDGIEASAVALHASIDARYRGQSYELTVPAAAGLDGFHEAHRRRYGHARPGEPIEIVVLRVEAVAAVPEAPHRPLEAAPQPAPDAADQARVWFGGQEIAAPLFARDTLLARHQITGPAIVTEYSATLWLPSGWRAEVRGDASLLLSCS
jgi:N-methylhydantoinase A